jgi:hypothetical protein
MLQLAWLWLRHQPGSALSRWFHERVGGNSRVRKIMIVALARKLLVALLEICNCRRRDRGGDDEDRLISAQTQFPHLPGSDQSRQIRVGDRTPNMAC